MHIGETRQSLILPAFFDVAEHDVEWYFRVKYRDSPGYYDNPCRDSFLSRGLQFIRQVATAQTYAERHELLADKLAWEENFLDYLLCEPSSNEHRQVHELTVEERRAAFDLPFYNDVDDPTSLEAPESGPFLAWRWAYQNEEACRVYYGVGQVELRRRGYVVFDTERLLDRWAIIERPFHFDWPPSHAQNWRFLELFKKHEKSRKIRGLLYESGATGWWSEEDESRLVWPDGRKDLKDNKVDNNTSRFSRYPGPFGRTPERLQPLGGKLYERMLIQGANSE